MKKVLWMLLSIVLIALMYYFFIKPHEFEVNLKANTVPGDLIETIRIWNRSLDNAKVIEVDSFSRLKQTIVREDRVYIYNWNFVALNDSVTKIKVEISEPSRTLLNRLLIPFTNQAIERDARDIGNEFYTVIKEHLRITKVKVLGEVELDSSFCACRFLETSQIEKANGMMKNYSLLASFINEYNLNVDGPPSVRILDWSHSQGQLKFDFCFTIIPTDSLPRVKEFTYKGFKKQRALKAEYRGNYITSDRAWYELIQYAKKNGYETTGMPIEYFHDNPTLGMNEFNWKADVYLPIIDN